MKISVVIPMHNAGKWLRETLDSIAAQTHPRRDIELLLVDDESTDDTAQIAHDFLRESGIEGRVIPNKSNGGCGAPRNAGWPLASGEWIQFVDADDILAPRKFEWQAACAARVPDDVAIVYSPWSTTSFTKADGSRGDRRSSVSSTTTPSCGSWKTGSSDSSGRCCTGAHSYRP